MNQKGEVIKDKFTNKYFKKKAASVMAEKSIDEDSSQILNYSMIDTKY